jgi:hypothetical protein
LIWLFILIPIILVVSIAIYYERKSGMTPPDLSEHAMKIDEVNKVSKMNNHSSGSSKLRIQIKNGQRLKALTIFQLTF